MQLTGDAGSIVWAYYQAARVVRYTVTRDKATKRWALAGHIVQADPFKLTQRPLMFTVQHAKGRWAWPIQGAVPVRDGPFAVDLGPLEK